MSKFRIGDPVRIIARPSAWFDHVGTVTDVNQGAGFPFRVTIREVSLWFGPHELILAEHQPRDHKEPTK